MPSPTFLPAPKAPFEVPSAYPERGAPAPAHEFPDVRPGLTLWGSEAIRLFAVELGYPLPLPATGSSAASPSGPAGTPLR